MRERITEYGQPYYDDPIYKIHALKNSGIIINFIREMFGEKKLEPIYEKIGNERIYLNWINSNLNNG